MFTVLNFGWLPSCHKTKKTKEKKKNIGSPAPKKKNLKTKVFEDREEGRKEGRMDNEKDKGRCVKEMKKGDTREVKRSTEEEQRSMWKELGVLPFVLLPEIAGEGNQ